MLSKPCPTVTTHSAVSLDFLIMEHNHKTGNIPWNVHSSPSREKILKKSDFVFKRLTDWFPHILPGKHNHYPVPYSFLEEYILLLPAYNECWCIRWKRWRSYRIEINHLPHFFLFHLTILSNWFCHLRRSFLHLFY